MILFLENFQICCILQSHGKITKSIAQINILLFFFLWQKKTCLNETLHLAEKLQFQTTNIISRFECEKLVPISFNAFDVFKRIRNLIHHNVICAKNEYGKGAWNGDSGGPLVTTINGINQIIGILSLSIDSANAQSYPNIYANVFSYSEWIRNNIEI